MLLFCLMTDFEKNLVNSKIYKESKSLGCINSSLPRHSRKIIWFSFLTLIRTKNLETKIFWPRKSKILWNWPFFILMSARQSLIGHCILELGIFSTSLNKNTLTSEGHLVTHYFLQKVFFQDLNRVWRTNTIKFLRFVGTYRFITIYSVTWYPQINFHPS